MGRSPHPNATMFKLSQIGKSQTSQLNSTGLIAQVPSPSSSLLVSSLFFSSRHSCCFQEANYTIVALCPPIPGEPCFCLQSAASKSLTHQLLCTSILPLAFIFLIILVVTAVLNCCFASRFLLLPPSSILLSQD